MRIKNICVFFYFFLCAFSNRPAFFKIWLQSTQPHKMKALCLNLSFFLQNAEKFGILVLLVIFLSVGFVWTMVTQMLAQIHFSPLHTIKNPADPATMAAKTPETQQPTGFWPNAIVFSVCFLPHVTIFQLIVEFDR